MNFCLQAKEPSATDVGIGDAVASILHSLLVSLVVVANDDLGCMTEEGSGRSAMLGHWPTCTCSTA